MKKEHARAHMRAAHVYADLSHCERKKVGCVIVKDGSIIAIGWNGTPSGECNICEISPDVTKPSVIHAEDNALRKLTRGHESAVGSTMFITLTPCILCAPRIVDAGVEKVVYDEIYRSTEGLDYLQKRGIKIEHIHIDQE